MPRTANGKLDRAALPAPGLHRDGGGRAPRDPREAVLCELFADLLGLPEVGIDDDFFSLGGDSIMSIQLVGRARVAGLVSLRARCSTSAPRPGWWPSPAP